jgi:hypothetical protein
MIWLAWVWIAVVCVALAVLVMSGTKVDSGGKVTLGARLKQSLPAIGMLACSITFGVLAVLESSHDPDISLWLVAILLASVSAVSAAWFSTHPWW